MIWRQAQEKNTYQKWSHKQGVRAGNAQCFGYASEWEISVFLFSICHDDCFHSENTTMYINDIWSFTGRKFIYSLNYLAAKVAFQKSQSHILTTSKGAYLYLGEIEIQKHLKWNFPSRKRCQFDSKSHPETFMKTGAHISVQNFLTKSDIKVILDCTFPMLG